MNETPQTPVNSTASQIMSNSFPLQIPERLPVRISPCPIVEAIFEARFVSPQPWARMPGLLFAQVRERYPGQKMMPLAQVPGEIRRKDPALLHQPLIQFLSQNFVFQLGSRLINRVTKPNEYPG